MADCYAEVEVDEALARALIGERFAVLDTRSLRHVGEGWDNIVWAGDGVVFFLLAPRDRDRRVEREIMLLPRWRHACRNDAQLAVVLRLWRAVQSNLGCANKKVSRCAQALAEGEFVD